MLLLSYSKHTKLFFRTNFKLQVISGLQSDAADVRIGTNPQERLTAGRRATGTVYLYSTSWPSVTCMCSLADEIDMLERLWLSGICHNDKIEVWEFSPRCHISPSIKISWTPRRAAFSFLSVLVAIIATYLILFNVIFLMKGVICKRWTLFFILLVMYSRKWLLFCCSPIAGRHSCSHFCLLHLPVFGESTSSRHNQRATFCDKWTRLSWQLKSRLPKL